MKRLENEAIILFKNSILNNYFHFTSNIQEEYLESIDYSNEKWMKFFETQNKCMRIEENQNSENNLFVYERENLDKI